MKINKIGPFLLFTFILILLNRSPYAENWGAQSLDSLQCIMVEVVVSDNLSKEITERQIKTDTELALRSHGINLIEPSDSTYSYCGALYITVRGFENSLKNGKYTGYICFTTTVDLTQSVLLPREVINSGYDANFHSAITWMEGTVAYCSVEDFNQYARRIIGDYVNEFINDFLCVNSLN